MDVRQPVHCISPMETFTSRMSRLKAMTTAQSACCGVFLFIASVRLPNLFDFLDIKLSLSIKKNNSAFAKT